MARASMTATWVAAISRSSTAALTLVRMTCHHGRKNMRETNGDAHASISAGILLLNF